MKSLKNIIINLVVKAGPVGNSPLAPGTICSLLASILGYIVNVNFGSDITLIIGSISGLVGFYFTKLYVKEIKKKDPQEIVIDEFSGQMIAISAAGVSPLFNFIAFILFRFFDIMKPGIISKSENSFSPCHAARIGREKRKIKPI